EAGDRHAGTGPDHGDLVAAVGADDDNLVSRAVAGATRRGQVDVDLLDVGGGEVVDRDLVGSAQGVDLDAFDVVEAHGDFADVAGEPRPAAIGREVHDLADVGAVEQHRVV